MLGSTIIDWSDLCIGGIYWRLIVSQLIENIFIPVRGEGQSPLSVAVNWYVRLGDDVCNIFSLFSYFILFTTNLY